MPGSFSRKDMTCCVPFSPAQQSTPWCFFSIGGGVGLCTYSDPSNQLRGGSFCSGC